MSDQDRISLYNINTISSRQAMRIKKNISWGIIKWSNAKFSQLSSKEPVRRITNKILGVKELKWLTMIIQSASDGKKIIQRLQDALS